jgi:outer membrane murein-binding lipoprotein Lpp
MSFEFLKPVLGDELYAQVESKLSTAQGLKLANIADGSFIPKSKFDEARTSASTLKAQVDDLTAKLAEAQSKGGDTSALQAKIDKLTSDIALKDQELSKQGFSYKVKDALRAVKVHNPDIVMSQLKLDKITEKDGKLSGFDEQIEALKKSDAYLFVEQTSARGGVIGGDQNIGGESLNHEVNNAIRQAAGRG